MSEKRASDTQNDPPQLTASERRIQELGQRLLEMGQPTIPAGVPKTRASMAEAVEESLIALAFAFATGAHSAKLPLAGALEYVIQIYEGQAWIAGDELALLEQARGGPLRHEERHVLAAPAGVVLPVEGASRLVGPNGAPLASATTEPAPASDGEAVENPAAELRKRAADVDVGRALYTAAYLDGVRETLARVRACVERSDARDIEREREGIEGQRAPTLADDLAELGSKLAEELADLGIGIEIAEEIAAKVAAGASVAKLTAKELTRKLVSLEAIDAPAAAAANVLVSLARSSKCLAFAALKGALQGTIDGLLDAIEREGLAGDDDGTSAYERLLRAELETLASDKQRASLTVRLEIAVREMVEGGPQS